MFGLIWLYQDWLLEQFAAGGHHFADKWAPKVIARSVEKAPPPIGNVLVISPPYVG